MASIKIALPEHFPFSANISVRITDINYGNHVGNDAVLGIIHEARMQFLRHFGYTELDFDGVGMIMKDVAIEFKKELFYGDNIKVSVACTNFTRAGFELYYKLEKEESGTAKTVAVAKTGMVCFDYDLRKIVAVPPRVITTLGSPRP